jgi:hypothetical protein
MQSVLWGPMRPVRAETVLPYRDFSADGGSACCRNRAARWSSPMARAARAQQGLDLLSLNFSPVAQDKAKALTARRQTALAFDIVDVHDWAYPENAY